MNEAVYQPWANCHKTPGLLGVLLLWENIVTITPASYKPDELNTFHDLLKCKDIVKELRVEKDIETISKATDRFIHVCKTKTAIDFVMKSIANSRHDDFPKYKVHRDKIALSRILDIKYRIPEYRIEHDRNWFYFPKELSCLYMCLLSEEIAGKRGAALLSDAEESSILYKRFFLENREVPNDNIEARKQAIIIDMVAEWMSIREDAPLMDILRFKEKNKQDLQGVHDVINQIKMKIPNAHDNAIMTSAAKEAIIELDERIKMIKSRLKYKGFVIQNAPLGSVIGLISSGAAFTGSELGTGVSLAIAGCGVLVDIAANALKGKAPPAELIERHRYVINARNRFSITNN